MATPRRLAAIMFTDMVGYTAANQVDESKALQLREEQEELIRRLIAARGGREVKSTGDGLLVEFGSALNAVQSAIDIIQYLQGRNAESGIAPIQVRIGIHLGDVEPRGDDIFGDSVNIAARIEPLAEPGGICISESVYGQVQNKISNGIEPMGPQQLKHIRSPMEVYRVLVPKIAREGHPDRIVPTGLAVLPFANISPDPNDAYFADGLTEELITVLSRLRGLRVTARTSVMPYRSTSKGVSQIGAELRVSSVLEGSVRKAGNQLRVTAQLIDVGSGGHLWAETYDRELNDVFAIQTEIAEKTAESLRIALVGPDRKSIVGRPRSSAGTYGLYLKGLQAVRLTTYEPTQKSIELFEEVIRQDPDFAPAYASLANAYVYLSGEDLAPRVAFPRAQELTEIALRLDPKSSAAHTARGNLALQYEQSWAIAEREFLTAISLNPSNAEAHFWYAIFLKTVRRFSEAEEELETTSEIDPLWELPRHWLPAVYVAAGKKAEAVALVEEYRVDHPASQWAQLNLGLAYASVGKLDLARKEGELSAEPSSEMMREMRANLRAKLGQPEELREITKQKVADSKRKYVSSGLIAQLFATLGESETALDWLEKDFTDGDRSLWFWYQSEPFDGIRSNPRFRELLRKMNLV